jgi:hypothetical protein
MVACSSQNQETTGSSSTNNNTGQENNQSSGEGNESEESGGSNSLDRTLIVGTSPVGSSHNSVANGFASVVSKNSSLQMTVSPFAGPAAWPPLVNKGEVDFGTASGPESTWAFKGENGFDPSPNLRLLVRGNYIQVVGAVVRQDSDIEKIRDLAGRRLTSDYPGSVISKMILDAALTVNGMSWDDVIQVPVPSTTAGIEALRDNQVDAAFALAPSTPTMQEVHNAVGLKEVGFLDDYGPDEIDQVPQEIIDQITERVPGGRLVKHEPEGFVSKETVGIAYPNHIVVGAHVPDEVVYEVMETLWNHYEELHPIHPWLAGFTPEQMFNPEPSMPYHPGAVQFFKDKGLWNDDVDAIQQQLMPK